MEQYANNPTSTITNSGGISTTATSLTVASAGPFPSSGTFRILVDGEIMAVTGVSGSTFTVTRGDGGSIAAAHAQGAGVFGILTAEALNAGVTIQAAGTEVSDRRVLNFVSGATVADNPTSGRCDITISGGSSGNGIGYGLGASKPAAGTKGNLYIPSDGVITSLDTGSVWVGLNPQGSVFTIPPVISNWTVYKDSSSYGTAIDIPGGGIQVAGNDGFCFLARPISSNTSYTLTAAFTFTQAYSSLGLAISDGTKVTGFGLTGQYSNYWQTCYASTLAGLNGGFMSPSHATNPAGGAPPNSSAYWARIVGGATYRTYYLSLDGINWFLFYQEAAAVNLTETYGGFYAAQGTVSTSTSPQYWAIMNLLSWAGI